MNVTSNNSKSVIDSSPFVAEIAIRRVLVLVGSREASEFRTPIFSLERNASQLYELSYSQRSVAINNPDPFQRV
jgi:hypothetical protein